MLERRTDWNGLKRRLYEDWNENHFVSEVIPCVRRRTMARLAAAAAERIYDDDDEENARFWGHRANKSMYICCIYVLCVCGWARVYLLRRIVYTRRTLKSFCLYICFRMFMYIKHIYNIYALKFRMKKKRITAAHAIKYNDERGAKYNLRMRLPFSRRCIQTRDYTIYI